MNRRNVFIALSLAALLITGCARKEEAAAAGNSKVEPAVAVTQVAETAPVAQTTANTTVTARGVVVRRAEAFQNGTTFIHLMVRTNGPNDEKVYLSFSMSSAFAPAPLAQVGDRVELTYIDRGWYEVQTIGITEPNFPEAGKK